MSASELLKIAGDAAEILETKGFTSVARLSDGVVTLELWRVIGRAQHIMRHVVTDEAASARLLAESCAVEFQIAMESSKD